MAEKNETSPESEQQVHEQAAQQVGRQVRMRMDDRNLTTTYANAFRTNGSPEEVILDFGLNVVTQQPRTAGGKDVPGEMVFQVNNRVVMNYYSAKRLAITLARFIQQHEQQFGALELNAAQRKPR